MRLQSTLVTFLLCAAATAAFAQKTPAPAPAPEPPKAAEPQNNGEGIKKLFEIIKKEPSIKDVQAAALGFYRLEPSRINGMVTAARLKGLLPELEGSLDNSLWHTFTNTKDGLYPILPSPMQNPNPDNYKERVQSDQDQLTWRVRAVWSLDRLAFNAESLDAKSLNSLGENLVREVTTLYFARRRLLASILLSPPSEDQELFMDLMKLDELTATIDAMTGGMFAKKAWKWEELLGK